MRKSSGFTLLEVLITLTILAALSLLASRALQQSLRQKTNIQTQVDDASRVRDALRLMERDIHLAFHYRDVEKELEEAIKKKNQSSSNPSGQQNPQGNPQGNNQGFFGNPAFSNQNQEPPREAPRHDPTTHFVCLENELHFVTMNNSRIQANVRQADFIEIGYSLKECQSGSQSTGDCLWRRSTPYVDSDVRKGGDELVLLENVTELKFRCIGRGKQDWVSQWDTGEGGDAVTKGNFPWAVEISLTYEAKQGERVRKYVMQTVAPIHFPNNKEEDGRNGNSQNSAQSPTSQPGSSTGQ